LYGLDNFGEAFFLKLARVIFHFLCKFHLIIKWDVPFNITLKVIIIVGIVFTFTIFFFTITVSSPTFSTLIILIVVVIGVLALLIDVGLEG